MRVRTSRVDRHVRLPVLVFDIFQIFRACGKWNARFRFVPSKALFENVNPRRTDSTVRILGSVAGPFGESASSATAVFLAGI